MEVLPNALALLTSLVAMVSLARIVPLLGGALGRMVRMLIVGIFLAVFLHAALELAAALGFVAEGTLMLLMAALLTLGSACFAYAGYLGKKAVE